MSFSKGSVLANRYELVRLIAVGGMGEVWEGIDNRLNRVVAIKILKSEYADSPEFLERFRAEAKSTASLNNPGIAAIFDYGETIDSNNASLAYLIMEYVAGEPLNAILARGKLPSDTCLDILEQTAHALQAAHTVGIVHRDVKPGNILITSSGHVKITDFGIAKAADAAPLTKTGMVMGTAQYISPEQAMGTEATPTSDVYSLGIVGYEMLSGARPFLGEGAITIAMKHIRETPPPLPTTLPLTVRKLIELSIVKNPAQRYANGGEFADAISDVRSGAFPSLPTTELLSAVEANAPETGPLPTGPNSSGLGSSYATSAAHHREPGHRVAAWIAGISLLAASIALVSWLLSGNSTPQPTPPTTPIETTETVETSTLRSFSTTSPITITDTTTEIPPSLPPSTTSSRTPSSTKTTTSSSSPPSETTPPTSTETTPSETTSPPETTTSTTPTTTTPAP